MAEFINKSIVHEVVVNASVEEVYKTWTTKEGLETFFAPVCEVELKLFGKFNIYFSPNNPDGTKGAEDEVIFSYEKNKMLSFSWGFPPTLKELRESQKTVVLLRFTDFGNNHTKVVFSQTGWGEGEDWQKGFEYFQSAWKEVVFPRFIIRFTTGPIDWGNFK